MTCWARLGKDGRPLEQATTDGAHPTTVGHTGEGWVEVPRRARPHERLVGGQWQETAEEVEADARLRLPPLEGIAVLCLSQELAAFDAIENKAAPGVKARFPWLAAIADAIKASMHDTAEHVRGAVQSDLDAAQGRAVARLKATWDIQKESDPAKMRDRLEREATDVGNANVY